MRHAARIAALLLLLAACEATPTPRVASGPRFERAAAGAVAPLVRAALGRAQAQHRRLVVYVGATWCEPCRYFHDAATRGELDAQLPSLTLLEFDLDRDRERLAEAGYTSRMIPLFVVPLADGRAGDRRMEGSIHGAGSPAEITPRLRAILGLPRP